MKGTSAKLNIQLLAKLALFVAAIIWGSSFVVMKNAIEMMPPFFLLATRFALAALILSLIFYKHMKNLNKEYIWQGFALGLALFCAYFWQTKGLALTTPGKNAFLTDIYCIVVPFLYWATDKVKPDRYNIFAIFLCMTGIGLVSLSGDLSVNIGDIYTLLGGLFFAVHIVIIAKVTRGKDPILVTVMQFASSAIFCGIYAFFAETVNIVPDKQMIVSFLYLTVFCSCIAFTFQVFSQKYTHPSTVSLILSLECVFGVIFSVLFYHEVLTLKIVCGFVLIFCAILVSETKLFFLGAKQKKREKLQNQQK